MALFYKCPPLDKDFLPDEGLKSDFLRRYNSDILYTLDKKRIKKMYTENPYMGRTITDQEVDYLYGCYIEILNHNVLTYNPLDHMSKKEFEELLDECGTSFMKLLIDGELTHDDPIKNLKIATNYQIRDRCFVCNKHTKDVCGICMKTKYCSKVCQKKDWKTHKLQCKKVTAATV